MANVGTWQSPLPMRLGGGSHLRSQRIYSEIRANVPGLFSNDDGKLNTCDDIAAARLIAGADRFIDRRLNQADPMKLSSEMVLRWESILAIVPGYQATWYDRRRAIAARLVRNSLIQRGDIDQVVVDAFAPWSTRLVFTPNEDAVKWWPGGSNVGLDNYSLSEWYSTVAHVVVEYVVSATATQAEIDRRVSDCYDALDNMLPAWATFDFSQTPNYGTTSGLFGFYFDRPNFDVAVFGA